MSATGNPPKQEILESEVRLSECLLWPLQVKYFQESGIAAWNQVPFYITSNPFIARAYAEVLVAFLLDYGPHLDPDEPVYILELGAGTGAFAFYLLKELQAHKGSFAAADGLTPKYVLTDFAEKNVAFWEAHEKLRPFRESGLLDFAVYRPDVDHEISLRESGRTLQAGGLKNPILVIANYFFDSLPHDVFRLVEGKLQEVRFTFSRDANCTGRPLSFDQLKRAESYRELKGEAFPDAALNAVLDSYTHELENATILFPIGALRCIQRLQSLSGNKLVLLASDKGFTTIEHKSVQGQSQEIYSLTGGISCMVNFHAIGRYFQDQGGHSLTTTDKTLSVHSTMNILSNQQGSKFERARYAFRRRIIEENPINYLYDCEDFLRADPPLKLGNYLAFLRLTNYDPVALVRCGDKLCQVIDCITAEEEEALLEVLDRTVENIYLLPPNQNAYLYLGRIFYKLELYGECLQVFQESEKQFGVDDQSLDLIPACYEAQGEYEAAFKYFQRALEARPESTYAHDGIQRMAAALTRRPE